MESEEGSGVRPLLSAGMSWQKAAVVHSASSSATRKHVISAGVSTLRILVSAVGKVVARAAFILCSDRVIDGPGSGASAKKEEEGL